MNCFVLVSADRTMTTAALVCTYTNRVGKRRI
jgi:hypothetical protein